MFSFDGYLRPTGIKASDILILSLKSRITFSPYLFLKLFLGMLGIEGMLDT